MALRADTIREFGELFATDSNATAQTHRATVKAVEGTTVYVDVSGHGDVTPIETTSAEYSIGDVVQVEQRGGRLHVTGNTSQPAVNAAHVRNAVKPVAKAAQTAQVTADEAANVANAVNQHFFTDDNGIHVTEVDRETWGSSQTGNNILINSLGILLRNALAYFVSITASATAFFDGLGNAAANIVASFGKDGAQIGYANESHVELDYHSLQMVDKEGETYFWVSDLRDEDGCLTETFVGDGATVSFWVTYPVSSVASVKVDGVVTTDYTLSSYRRFTFTTAPSSGAEVAIRYISTDSDLKAYTLGKRGSGNVGAYSVAEGFGTVASDKWSHAEGSNTTAYGYASHAEGAGTATRSDYAHAEGYGTVASGAESHAQNSNTIAASSSQTAMGKYNVSDSSNTYALIIGNGTADNARSNALAVDWDGYVYPQNTKMTDFVTDSGTTSGWEWRKWKSGKAEAWANGLSLGSQTPSVWVSPVRYKDLTPSIPSGIFSSAPTVTMTSTSSQWWVVKAEATSATSMSVRLATCASSAQTATVNVYAIL